MNERQKALNWGLGDNIKFKVPFTVRHGGFVLSLWVYRRDGSRKYWSCWVGLVV